MTQTRLLNRIRQEFQEHPGIALTFPQARRLWSLEEKAGSDAFDALLAEGSVTTREARRRVVTRGRPARLYALTDAGREQAAGAPAPWTAVAGENESELMTLRDLAHQVLAATRQVAHAGTAAQIEAAQVVLRDARKALYRLLAEDEDAS